MAEVTPSLIRCFWKVAGLLDAIESQVGEILDLRKDNEILEEDRLEEQFSQNEIDGTLSEDV